MTRDQQEAFANSTTQATEATRPDFYYNGSGYFLDSMTEFIPMDQRSVTRHLKGSGLTPAEIDQELNRIQIERHVNYAGPLAGHSRGLHQSSGRKLLATSSPRIIASNPGLWLNLKRVIEGLLGDDPDAGERQVQIFLGWVKAARDALVGRRRRPGQALVLAGPPNSGKSLLIDLIELILGGRRANPYPNFSGRTAFNGDLAGAELLAVDDEAGSTDIRARKNLAASIKSSLFAGSVRIEGKHRDGFVFRPLWRLVIACNDEPESLMVIPPLTTDIADKLTLLRCHKRPLPMPAHTLDEREAFFAALVSEIPAMLHALDGWSLPPDMAEERCGVIHYHHPGLVHALGELAPETAMLGLVDTLADAGNLVLPWTGTAAELRAILMNEQSTRRDAERLLHWTQATGGYLGKLEGERVRALTKKRGIQRWRIMPYPEGVD
jgi:hypothetical protein